MVFPGMDPYLEHPHYWPSIQQCMAVYLCVRLQPQLLPRFVASVRARIYHEDCGQGVTLECSETYITILDRRRELGVVTWIEILNPSYKAPGPRRDAHLARQRDVLSSGVHLVEIYLLRTGLPAIAAPAEAVERCRPFAYMICVNRADGSPACAELTACQLRARLPVVRIPVAIGEPDTSADVQSLFETVYTNACYDLTVRYDRSCVPPLSAEDQAWACELIRLAAAADERK